MISPQCWGGGGGPGSIKRSMLIHTHLLLQTISTAHQLKTRFDKLMIRKVKNLISSEFDELKIRSVDFSINSEFDQFSSSSSQFHLLVGLLRAGPDDPDPSPSPERRQVVALPTLHQHPDLRRHRFRHLHALEHQVSQAGRMSQRYGQLWHHRLG